MSEFTEAQIKVLQHADAADNTQPRHAIAECLMTSKGESNWIIARQLWRDAAVGWGVEVCPSMLGFFCWLKLPTHAASSDASGTRIIVNYIKLQTAGIFYRLK